MKLKLKVTSARLHSEFERVPMGSKISQHSDKKVVQLKAGSEAFLIATLARILISPKLKRVQPYTHVLNTHAWFGPYVQENFLVTHLFIDSKKFHL